MSREIHVTRVVEGRVYGHLTDDCDVSGCSGGEQYFPGARSDAAKPGDVLAVLRRADSVEVIYDRTSGPDWEGWFVRIHGQDVDGEGLMMDCYPPWIHEADGADDDLLRQLAVRTCQWEGFTNPDRTQIFISR